MFPFVLNSCEKAKVQDSHISEKLPAEQINEIDEVVSFNEHIRPILSDKCFSCHGFDSTTREENLRLDTKEGAYAALETDHSMRAIVPGHPDSSAVWERIMSTDSSDVMPPPKHNKPLSDKEKELISIWISQGAEYEEHWAFAPIARPKAPSEGHPVDAFIRAKLKIATNLEPAPIADKATLLRRLSLDLIGLPPTPEEVENFVADDSQDAYDKQVERLLASSHYGERMAVPWLDAVRYADTVGYHGDQNVRIFPYRDYVINSFNENKPFDKFTREQIAGDLIPNATEEQRIATGFLRLNLMTREGGAQPAEYMAKSGADRVRAIGGAWLGLTTGCAECHDHKFDPFTAKDFYSMAAFFADVRQWGVYQDYEYTPNEDLKDFSNEHPFPPEIHVESDVLKNRLNNARRKSVEAVASSIHEFDEVTLLTWKDKVTQFLSKNPDGWLRPNPEKISRSKASAPSQASEGLIALIGEPTDGDSITVEYLLSDDLPVKTIRLEVFPHRENNNKVGRSEDGKFSVKPSFFVDEEPLQITYRQANLRTPHTYQNGYPPIELNEWWRSAPERWVEPNNAAELPHFAHYHLKTPLLPLGSRTLRVVLETKDLGAFRIAISPFADAVPTQKNAFPKGFLTALESPTADATKTQLIGSYILSTQSDSDLPQAYHEARREMLNNRGGYAYSMIAQTLPPDEIPATHLLDRGSWMTPKEEVKPAVPAYFDKTTASHKERLDRMDLANWILAEENPLTRRYFVNRLWNQFFGVGISGVLNDLGNQSEWPSHPDLLNYLASEFYENDWDVKALVRLIVTSDTYKQKAAYRKELAKIDPENRFLSEQNPRRLDAEFIRDNALAIAGQLDLQEIGGPSIKPYQPGGYWDNLTFPHREYETSQGTEQNRRGVYTFWQRTFLHPMLAAFDAPSREECTADRFMSNSPQQALSLLNDPTFAEAASALAASTPPGTEEERIRFAFKRTLSREPSREELSGLQDFLTKIAQSESEAVPFEQLCRVLLNLHETITRY